MELERETDRQTDRQTETDRERERERNSEEELKKNFYFIFKEKRFYFFKKNIQSETCAEL